MQAWHTVLYKVAALGYSPFYTYLFHIIVSLTATHCFRQLKGKVAPEGLGYRIDLRQLGEWLGL